MCVASTYSESSCRRTPTVGANLSGDVRLREGDVRLRGRQFTCCRGNLAKRPPIGAVCLKVLSVSRAFSVY